MMAGAVSAQQPQRLSDLAALEADLALQAASLSARGPLWSGQIAALSVDGQAALMANMVRSMRPQLAGLQVSGAELALYGRELAAQSRALALQSHALAGPWVGGFVAGQDSIDGLYRRARYEFSRGNYETAIDAFRELQRRYVSSRYVPLAMYYEAFSLYRKGEEEDLRRALQVLEAQIDRHPNNVTEDTASLATRIQGALARRGDAGAAEAIVRRAQELAETRQGGSAQPQGGSCDDNEPRMAALSALMHMDADNALPILRRVLQNRDGSCVEMRRRAIFIVAQQRSSERESILLEAAQSDPDLEVRKTAVFHLSQVQSDAAVAALDSILRNSREPELQERAIFALSQHRSERAAEILQRFARQSDAPTNLRANAIHWLGQNRQTSAQFLRDLYRSLPNDELREKVIFALSQHRDESNADFLLSIAVDANEPLEMRKRALFWVGQMRGTAPQLYQMYEETTDREMREQLIFVYSQRRRDTAAMDKLIDIARNETDRELRNKAIFWLGQSKDPRAIRVLEEIINND
jgi:HEAT repeat protein/TolA-binding protein